MRILCASANMGAWPSLVQIGIYKSFKFWQVGYLAVIVAKGEGTMVAHERLLPTIAAKKGINTFHAHRHSSKK